MNAQTRSQLITETIADLLAFGGPSPPHGMQRS
jgi:hypothetical protein